MYNYKDKYKNIRQLNDYMFTRTLAMFEYEGLPETLPHVELEKQLQTHGFSFITEVNGELYAFTGGMGGEPDPYGNPTYITINNPALNFNKTLHIENDGVLIQNDDMMMGLLPLFEKYNTLLTENEITMFVNSFNTRIQTLISAGDDNTRESAEKFLNKVQDGDMAVIGENRLFDGINAQPAKSNTANETTQLIEFHQYMKASLYNEIGLNSNYNMKRERLNSDEVKMNDSLYPLVHNMLENRVKGVDKVNNMFDHNLRVMFGSIWEIRDINENVQPEEETPQENEPIEEPTTQDNEPIIQDVEPDQEPVEPVEEPTTQVDQEDVEPIEEPTTQDVDESEENEPTPQDVDEAHEINDIVDEAIEHVEDDENDEDDEEEKGVG